MAGTGELALAALVWIGVHVGIAGTALRAAVVSRTSVNVFRGAFTIASVAAIVFLVNAYNGASGEALWAVPGWLTRVLALAMLPALVLFVGSFTAPSATMAGAEARPPAEFRGMQRITRHPMLCGFGIWAAVHILANGTVPAVLLFGAFLVTVVAGIPSIDAKLATRDPVLWDRVRRETSAIPFGAILDGRNRLAISEIMIPIGVGALGWAAMLWLHPVIFGVPAVWG